MVPSDTMFFVQFMTMQESEAILRKGCRNLKRKLGVTMNFSKIDKLQFGGKCYTCLYVFVFVVVVFAIDCYVL